MVNYLVIASSQNLSEKARYESNSCGLAPVQSRAGAGEYPDAS